MDTPKFKIILVGDSGVGKTSLVRRYATGEYQGQYEPTIGVEVHPLAFTTSKGNVKMNIWDTAGQETLGGLRDAYYTLADGALIMFDVTNKASFDNVGKWLLSVRKICGSKIPVVVLGNKVECEAREVSIEEIRHFLKEHKLSDCYYDISVHQLINFDLPMLSLIRKLRNDRFIYWVEQKQAGGDTGENEDHSPIERQLDFGSTSTNHQ